MKRYIKASVRITNNELYNMLKYLSIEDEQLADRLINRYCNRYGIERSFSQAEMLNQLPEDAYNELIEILTNPIKLKSAFKKTKKKADRSVSLYCKYEKYGREADGFYDFNVSGKGLEDALKKIVKHVYTPITIEEIEDEHLDANDILTAIDEDNGMGCDWIVYLKNMTDGKVYIDHD